MGVATYFGSKLHQTELRGKFITQNADITKEEINNKNSDFKALAKKEQN